MEWLDRHSKHDHIENGMAIDSTSQYPDIAYIREKISVAAVASELGLWVHRHKCRCWRREKHRHGDRDPSIGFQRDRNRGRCFICDPHTWSNIDLVMMVRGYEMLQAAFWIAERFPVPDLPKGVHARKREAWNPRYMAGANENLLTLLVRCGLWADLSGPETRLLPALITFQNRESDISEVSYRGLMRYSGVGSPASVSKALKRFEQMKILKVLRFAGMGMQRGVNRYALTPDDPEFQALTAKLYQRTQEEVKVERELRKLQQKAKKLGKGAPVQVILSSRSEARTEFTLQLE